jgi:signal transduction histidine kinase
MVKKLILVSSLLTLLFCASFYLVCRLDPDNLNRLYQAAYLHQKQLGLPVTPPPKVSGRFIPHTEVRLWLLWAISLAALGSAWLAQQIRRPLAQLAQACQNLSSSQLPPDHPFPQLRDRFQRMLEDISRQEQQTLEQIQKTQAGLQRQRQRLAQAHQLLAEPLSQLPQLAHILEHLPGPQKVDLEQLVNQVLQRFPPHTATASGPPIQLQLDPWPLRQALQNLIDNARRYPPVQIGWDQHTLWVQDQGPGFDPAQISQGRGIGLKLAAQHAPLQFDFQNGTRATILLQAECKSNPDF